MVRPVGPFSEVSLSPVSFLERSEFGFRDRPAYVDEERSYTYAEFAGRCRRLSGALIDRGYGSGSVIAVLAPNTNVLLECHFGIPLAGGVLNAINTRLAPLEILYILEHSGARCLIVHEALSELLQPIAAQLAGLDIITAGSDGSEYERVLSQSSPTVKPVVDELDLIALNYTSGTTGRPKGVMYSHRGAFLQSLAMVSQAKLDARTRFLWTLPMFHCNGWTFTWAVTAAGGTHIGLPKVDGDRVWENIRKNGVTHMNCAPTVLSSVVAAAGATAGPAPRPIQVATGGAPPSPALIQQLTGLNMNVTHLYGLTETYGPSVVCEWQPEWDTQTAKDTAVLRARQGISNVVGRPIRVIDLDDRDVPEDGATLGEVVIQGNNVMLGYFNDPEATSAVNANGWFRTGDLGVVHVNGYVELRDRAKDVIISGGENITSIEVEQAIASHPAVLEVAVVSKPDAKWGEVPAAFVTLKPGSEVTDAELMAHVRRTLAGFKVPKTIVFQELPKNGTGKIQKFLLKKQLWSGTGPESSAHQPPSNGTQ
ncbi:MAG: AMP-binding protein [Actinobacteria bacterium]|uniref:Unannotated protein n=1 Tax=freshwater metagenome TaxID=449393 RepID=A0A6J7L876_9ZZZZ|nr:AMP-binding protein [Actinomycetota bacterium]